MFQTSYNPDVLSCLANLSNDEVFTSPALANKVLDLLPEKIWSDKSITFLDPVCKTGVFLREITKRLINGLEKEIPNQQKRIDHILTKQVFGIAITELTGLMSRRTLYCSKKANSKYSVCTKFDTEQGNILYKKLKHTWEDGRCTYCGATQEVYDRDSSLESYAYQFIHTDNPENLFNMKFDVIIGNPPYQLSDGGDASEESRIRGGAIPIYQKFVLQAKKLSPRYLTMIIPSRWFSGGRGLDDFRSEMINDKAVSKLVDYPLSSECFPGVEIKGGVCYFLWENGRKGDCEIKTIRGDSVSIMTRPLLESGNDIFIRYNESISIFRKIKKNEKAFFDVLVSSQKPFGFRTFFKGKNKPFDSAIKLYGNKEISYVKKDEVQQNPHWINKYKVLVTMAYGAGEDFPHQIINKPFLAEPGTCCTETYVVIGPFENATIAKNAISYMATKFFRFMVLLKKNTQHASKSVYEFVPLQNFNEHWDDKKLYKKYSLTKDEIAFIESMIRPMELDNIEV